MSRISLFECSLCWSDVVLSCVVFVCGHVSLVDYACDEAVVVERTLVFFFLQLHPFCSGMLLLVRIFLLLLLMMLPMYGI